MKRWPVGATAVVAGCAVALTPLPALAAATNTQIIGALDIDASTVDAASSVGDPAGIAVAGTALGGLPTGGSDYLVLSTGNAGALAGSAGTFASTDLAGAGGADGNDLTQVRLDLTPPGTATCIGFDFAFLSEEYPEWVGFAYNDIFTAELNESSFSIIGNNQVVAPHNFAYDSAGNAVSVNTVFGMAELAGTTMDGATPLLSATSPVEKRLDGTMSLILSIQDLGDSIYDSVVLVDNLRWLYGANCTTGVTPLADADGDGLSDAWETDGIDYDNDGVPEVDLPAMGADPQHRDLFVEVDWMVKDDTCIWFICWGGENFAPQRAALDDVVAAFAAAPNTNPDGTTGVRMHIDSGPDSVMNPVTGATWGAASRANSVGHQESLGSFSGSDYDWSDFDGIKGSNFETVRQDAFHYVVYADTYAGSDSSGISRGIPGSDLLVTDGADGWGDGFTRTQERGTFMHELGHNLDLWHGGGPTGTNNYNTAYRSIMNYAYQLVGLPPGAGLDYSRGAPYDDWANVRFDGGSVGDLGDSAPPLQLTPSDSLDPDEAKQQDVFAKDGDGTVRFIGPTVLVPGTGMQSVHVDVTNAGSVPDTFTVDVVSADGSLTTQAQATVAGGDLAHIDVPVDTAALPFGTLELTVTLSSSIAGQGLSSESVSVQVPNPDDPTVRAAAEQALDDLAGLPAGSGLDPAVQAQLLDMLAAIVAWDATVTTTGRPAFARDLEVDPPVLTPSAAAPTSIAVESVPGSPQLSLSVQSGPGASNAPVFFGTLTVEEPSGQVRTFQVQAGKWDPATNTFTGTFRDRGAGGKFTLALTPPA